MIDFTNKPSWGNAPEWSNYLAMDSNYDWWWYEKQPVVNGDLWDNQLGKYSFAAEFTPPFWKETLEQKPDNK